MQETGEKVKTTVLSAKDTVASGVSSLYNRYWKKQEAATEESKGGLPEPQSVL